MSSTENMRSTSGRLGLYPFGKGRGVGFTHLSPEVRTRLKNGVRFEEEIIYFFEFYPTVKYIFTPQTSLWSNAAMDN